MTNGGVFKHLIKAIVNARHRNQRKSISAVKRARLYRYKQELKAADGALATALQIDYATQQKNGNLAQRAAKAQARLHLNQQQGRAANQKRAIWDAKILAFYAATR